MNKMSLFVLLAAVSLIVLFGCTGKNYPNGNNYSNSQENQTGTLDPASISIKNFAFSPPSVTVSKGAIVTWTNEDSAPHTITGIGLDSGSLSNGQSFTFNEAGTYTYICSIHPSMKGTVIVQ
jgi:plastocyanin